MKEKPIFKRVLASVLASAIMFTNMPTAAFAATWDESQLTVHRNDAVAIVDVVDAIVDDKTTDVTVTVSKDVNGETVTATVGATTAEGVKFFIGDNYDEAHFATGGNYELVKGVGTVNGQLNTAAQEAYDSLATEASAAKAETEAAKEAVKTAESNKTTVDLNGATATLAKEAAEIRYDNAVADEADAKVALDKAVDDLANYETRIEEKKAELEAQKAANAESLGRINEMEASIQSALDAAGYTREVLEDCAANNIHSHKLFNTCKLALQGIQALDSQLASERAKVDASNAEIAQLEEYLASNDADTVRVPFEKAVTDAQAAYDAAAANLATKRADYEATLPAYNDAKAASAAAQVAVDEANAALVEKQNAETAKWDAVKAYMAAITAADVVFDAAEVAYTKGSTVYPFSVVVYDNLTIKLVDAQGTLAAIPEINVEVANRNSEMHDMVEVYKVYEGEGVEINPAGVNGYTYTVTGAEAQNASLYVIPAMTSDSEVVITYTEIGASTVHHVVPEGAKLEVTVDGVAVDCCSTVKAGKTVTVKGDALAGYELTSVKVTDKNGAVVLEGNGTFVANGVEEDEYTVTLEVKLTGAIVKEGTHHQLVKGVKFYVDGQEYQLGDVIPSGKGKVLVVPELEAGYGVKAMQVALLEGTTPAFVSKTNEGFEFETVPGHIYEVSFVGDDNFSDIYSYIDPVAVQEHSTVKVFVDGMEYAAGAPVIAGSEVKVVITPETNYYVNVVSVLESGEFFIPTFETNLGVYTVKFTANEGCRYTISYGIGHPVLAANNEEVTVNKVDIALGNFDKVEEALANGFDTVTDITLHYEYLAGTFAMDVLPVEIPVWLPIDTTFSYAEIANSIWEKLNEISPVIGATVSKNTIQDTIQSLGTSMFHNFGDQEVESVRAVFDGKSSLPATTSDARNVNVKDLRTEVDLDINTEASFVYGEIDNNEEVIAKLLEGKAGVVVDGAELDDKYDDMLVLDREMAGLNAGEYKVVVSIGSGDNEYKDNDKVTVTIKIAKAKATVTVTDNNMIAYENVGALTRDYLIQVSPEDVEHIAFIMGVDAKVNDADEPEVFAKIDMSKTSLNAEIFGYNLLEIFTEKLDPEGDGLSLVELANKLPELKELLKSLNLGDTEAVLAQYIDPAILVAALEKAAEAFTEFGEYADVKVYLVNDETAIVPNNIGAYVIGAATTDANYNTAANATAIVISAKPATVKFEGVDENNNATFKYDGEAKALTAKAYNSLGFVLKGEMQYLYSGIDTAGNVYASAEAPVNAGVYTVLATFIDEAKHNAGFAIATIVIEGADITIKVEDKEIVCECGCDEVTCEKDPCYKHEAMLLNAAEFLDITVTSENGENEAIRYITIIEDGRGGVNVIMPEGSEYNDAASYGIDDLIKALGLQEKLGENEAVAAIREFIEAWLEENGYEVGISFNGALPTRCGEYNVTVIAYGVNHGIATANAKFSIVPAEHVCVGGEATCATKAQCEVCEEYYGDLNPDNHEEPEAEWVITEDTHAKVYGCCGAEEIAEEAHKGGEATCEDKAVCEVCDAEYGELDTDNHTGESKWTITDEDHVKAYECCGAIEVEKAAHSGGEATCEDKAVCEVCDAEYGELNEDNHTGESEWTITETEHEKKYECCGTVEVEKAAHSGGQATCEDKAKCEVCDAEYGELDKDNHTGESKWTITDEEHEKKYECCGAVEVEKAKHSGGKATCEDKAKCEVCGAEYGDVDKDAHTGESKWTITEDEHEKKYECCGAVEVEKAEHSGGKATCEEKAKCDVCGAEYGEVDEDAHTKDAKWYITAKDHEQKYECCGKVVVEKTEHSGGKATTSKKAVCEVCGTSYGELLPKEPSKPDNSATAPDDLGGPSELEPIGEAEEVVEEVIEEDVDVDIALKAEDVEDEAPKAEAPAKAEKGNLSFLWWIVGAAGGAFILWFIILFFKKDDEDEE